MFDLSLVFCALRLLRASSAILPESNNAISALCITWPPVFSQAAERACFASFLASLTESAIPLPRELAEIPPPIDEAKSVMKAINLFINEAITQMNKIEKSEGIPSGLPILPTSDWALVRGGNEAIFQNDNKVMRVMMLIVQTSSQQIL